MPFFHASLLSLNSTSMVAPGAWGARIIASGVRHSSYFRELELERARERVDVTLPSRFSCAFAFSDVQYATVFAQNQAAQQGVPVLLYEVESVIGSDECRLSMDYIDGWSRLCTREEIEQWTDDYWRAAPYVESDSEVLVTGGLLVTRQLDRLLPPGW